jgi:hypothetical protein
VATLRKHLGKDFPGPAGREQLSRGDEALFRGIVAG